jgi:zinc protease
MLRPMRRLLGVLLALALSATLGCASAPRPPVRGLPPPSRAVLPNGARLVVQEHRTSDIVALQLWVGVGSRDEGPEERGFAHFAEHMLFKGTETLPRGFVDREVEAVGGRTNAGTSYDYTYYYMLLPAARAVRGIEVLADIAVNSRFDPDELDREREVVFEEMRLGEDNPRSALYRRLYDLVFHGHAYGRPVLGDPAALRSATRATLREFYRRHYTPENMTLVVAGPVDPAAIRAAAAGSLGRIPRTGQVRVRPAPPEPIGTARTRIVERPERQAALGLGFLAPPLGHDDMAAVDLLAHILGGSTSSRLNQALRERRRLVSSVSAGYSALERGGVLSVTAQFEPADEARVETEIIEELRRLRDSGVTTEELARAVTAAEADRLFSEETVEGLALAYGRAETIWGLEEHRRYLDRVRAVTRDDIQAAARRYLSQAHARLAFLPRRQPP